MAYEGRYSEAEEEMRHLPDKFRRAKQTDIAPSADLSLYAFLKKDFNESLSHATYMLKQAQKFNREPAVIFAKCLLGIAHLKKIGKPPESEVYLNEAIVSCRRIKLLELEPDILLSIVRCHHLRDNVPQAREKAQEALTFADRYDYRLKQADIHNFLARLALETGDYKGVRQHAQTAYERAWCDGPPHTYNIALEEAKQLLNDIPTSNDSNNTA
ncbi:MAG: hypothetical protein HZB54_08165 [Deltaproteobacteria bacterium]|nr:hypothetical protein [Deltaproteobacteria bacterium]